MVIVPALDPNFGSLNLAKDDGLLRAIKICNMTSSGGGVKPSAPCHTILWHVEEP
jgi:hypothetical protein